MRVKRFGAVSFLTEQTSMWSCLNRASHGFQSGMAISPGDSAGFFTHMGYDPDTLQLEGISPPIVRVRDLYRGLTNRYGLAIRSESAGGPQVVIEHYGAGGSSCPRNGVNSTGRCNTFSRTSSIEGMAFMSEEKAQRLSPALIQAAARPGRTAACDCLPDSGK
jgi:hypothetical protein